MPDEIRCDLCGNNRYRVLYQFKAQHQKLKEDKNNYLITDTQFRAPERIVKCLQCGLIYVSPLQETRKILSSYRTMVDTEYELEEKGRRIQARLILRRLSRFKKGRRILDIGCATGFLLDEAKGQGWEVSGVELSRWCVDHMKKNLGINVFCGLLEDAKFKDSFFDVVVLKDTIEHLTNPKETLREIYRILRPDGLLYINTPNITSLVSRVLRARWWGINHAHLFYFTKKTLYKLLATAGFEVVQCRSYPRTFSIRYWGLRCRSYNVVLYKIFTSLATKAFAKNRLIAVNMGDQIEVYARKKRRKNT